MFEKVEAIIRLSSGVRFTKYFSSSSKSSVSLLLHHAWLSANTTSALFASFTLWDRSIW